jgi:hypothetical protein
VKSSPQHSNGYVQAYVRFLKRCDAPASLISDFLNLVEIDNGIASEPNGSLESLDRLLFDSCRKYNFPKPFDSAQGRAWIRPSLLDGHPDQSGDIYGWDDHFRPREEEAYRRGYSQGFANARQHINEGKIKTLEEREQAINKWRFAKVWFGPSQPGSVEPFGLKVSMRSSISKSLRWSIFKRDGNRCVVCGAGAVDGVTLHVDHIISVYNGGTNDAENLQTLCEPCNLGKGKD